MHRFTIVALLILTASTVLAQNRRVALVFPTGHPQFSSRARGEIMRVARKNKISVTDYRIKNITVALLKQHDAVLLMLTPSDYANPRIKSLLENSETARRNSSKILVWHLGRSKQPSADAVYSSVDAVSSSTIKKQAKPLVRKRIIPFILGNPPD